MSKHLFISAVQNMVDFKTIFVASKEFWAGIYDAIHAGRTDGIDQAYITIYKTIHFIEMTKNDYVYGRGHEMRKEQRTLLSAIEQRIAGRHVTVMCLNHSEKMRAEHLFDELLDVVKDGYKDRIMPQDYLTRGQITFLHLTPQNEHLIRIKNPGYFDMRGMDIKDVFLFMPNVLSEHYLKAFQPYQEAYERFSDDAKLSRFIGLAEQAINQKNARKNQQNLVNAMQANPVFAQSKVMSNSVIDAVSHGFTQLQTRKDTE